MNLEIEAVHAKVRERYSRAARDSCCKETMSRSGDYSDAELAQVPMGTFLGLGSGNPVRHASLRRGETVVDLGSGAGIDVFLAASIVGPQGRAIGVDFTPAMIERAAAAAKERGTRNVAFHRAPIERLPLDDATVDVVLSNCVINLSPKKSAVFAEAFRALKAGGRLVISDIVREGKLAIPNDDCGCVATAMVRRDYLETIRRAGFVDLRIVEDRPWTTGPEGVEASALTIIARKKRGR